jgi:hypothetical protein
MKLEVNLSVYDELLSAESIDPPERRRLKSHDRTRFNRVVTGRFGLSGLQSQLKKSKRRPETEVDLPQFLRECLSGRNDALWATAKTLSKTPASGSKDGCEFGTEGFFPSYPTSFHSTL